VFQFCLSLDVLVASVGFELGTVDPTVGITQFLKWKNQEDASNKVCYESAMVLLELRGREASSGIMRAATDDQVMAFLAGRGRNLAS